MSLLQAIVFAYLKCAKSTFCTTELTTMHWWKVIKFIHRERMQKWEIASNKLRKVETNKSLWRIQLGEEIKLNEKKKLSYVVIYVQSRKDTTINYLSLSIYHMFCDLSPYCPGSELKKITSHQCKCFL